MSWLRRITGFQVVIILLSRCESTEVPCAGERGIPAACGAWGVDAHCQATVLRRCALHVPGQHDRGRRCMDLARVLLCGRLRCLLFDAWLAFMLLLEIGLRQHHSCGCNVSADHDYDALHGLQRQLVLVREQHTRTSLSVCVGMSSCNIKAQVEACEAESGYLGCWAPGLQDGPIICTSCTFLGLKVANVFDLQA